MVPCCGAVSPLPLQAPSHIPAEIIPSTVRMQPAELAGLLAVHKAPLILQVGSRGLYEQAHIRGAEYVAAAGTPDGLDGLRRRVVGLDRAEQVVLYCGCCPWSRCPNIRPAFQLLRSLGFTHVRVLYLEGNFEAGWTGRGFPLEQGH